MFVGIPTGIFRHLSVEATFVTVPQAVTAIQMVAANEAQLAHVTMLDLLIAKKANPQLPVCAVYLHDIGSVYEIVIPETSVVKTISELEGSKVGIANPNDPAAIVARAMLRRAGINPGSVDLVAVGTAIEAAAGVTSNRLQALALSRSVHAGIESSGIPLRYFSPGIPGTVLIAHVNHAWHRERIILALQGVVMNTVYLQTNPAASVRAHWALHGKPSTRPDIVLRDQTQTIRRAAELWKQRGSAGMYGDMNNDTWLKVLDFLGSSFEFDRTRIKSLYSSDLISAANTAPIARAIELANAEEP